MSQETFTAQAVAKDAITEAVLRDDGKASYVDVFDSRAFRNALGRFCTGVTVITTQHEGQVHGMTASAFLSVSLNPPMVLVSVDNRATMHRMLSLTGRYGVSVLSEDQRSLSDHFSGRNRNAGEVKFVELLGMPLLKGALASFLVTVLDIHPAGDHTLFIGRVEHFEAREGQPLLFYSGTYQEL